MTKHLSPTWGTGTKASGACSCTHRNGGRRRKLNDGGGTARALRGPVPAPEPWVTKQQLAEHLGVTTRWIELQQHLGLPHLRMGGINRYWISEVEAWLRERYASTAEKAS